MVAEAVSYSAAEHVSLVEVAADDLNVPADFTVSVGGSSGRFSVVAVTTLRGL